MGSQYTAAWNAFSRPSRVAYPEYAVRGSAGFCARYLREHWKKISAAILGGVLAGFLAGVVSSRENTALNQVVYAAGASERAVATHTAAPLPSGTGATQATVQEVSRLKAENQQLQALVEELQKEHPATHSRKVKAHRKRHSAVHA